MKKFTLTVFCILAGCIFFLSGIWVYFQKSMDKVDLGEGEYAASYQKHYLMISNDKDTLMWQSIYQSASETAKEADAYVELLSPEQMKNYTQEDCLRIGIASHVDGIILEADGSKAEQKLIEEAAREGIPVVTILTDDSACRRISFVGLNSYEMGSAYTDQIAGMLNEKGTTQILFLSTSSSKTQETNLVYYQVKKELESRKKTGQSVNLSEYCVDSSADFDTEEFVRDMFVNEESLPDVLVCMDEVVTECVYQALVDYNQVGNVKVIGYYYSDVILNAIDKGILSSTIAMDMDEVGKYSVNALEEYLSLGHSNGYYSVNQARAPGYRPVYENLSGISLYSAIVPVPPRVKKNRAENMPLLLAQRLGRILHIPVIQPLCLTRQVLPQKSLDQQKRFANVKDAYACRTGVDLSGMRLLLLDDVITTGATISACAKALLEGGAVSVDGVCVAATELMPKSHGAAGTPKESK